MKKAFSFLFILILLVVLASPAITGYFARKQDHEFWQAWADSSGMTFQVSSKKAGFLTSESKYQFRLAGKLLNALSPDAEGMDKMPTFVIDNKLYHGLWPITFPGQKTLALAKARSALNLKVDGKTTLLPGHLDTVVRLDGSTKLHYHVKNGEQSFEQDNGDTLMFAWSDIDLQAHIGRAIDYFDYQGKINNLSFSSKQDNESFAFSGLDFSGKQDTKQFDHVWLGDGRMGIDQIAFNQGNAPLFELTDLSMSTNASARGDLVKANMNFQISNINADVAKDISFNMNTDINNLHGPTLSMVNAMLKDLQSGNLDGFDIAKAMSLAGKIAAAGPSMSIDTFEFKTPAGDVVGNFDIALPQKDGDEAFNPGLLLMDLTSEGQLNIPVLLLDRYFAYAGQDNMAETLQNQGMLVKRGDFYAADFRFEFGQATLNGQPIPLGGGGLGGGPGF